MSDQFKTENTDQTFSRFYKDELKPVLASLNKRRLQIRRNAFLIGIGAGALVLAVVIFVILHIEDEEEFKLLMASPIAALVAGGFYINSHKAFFKEFKDKVVRKIFEYVDGSFSYYPNQGVSEEVVLSTGLFKEPKKFSSEDKSVAELDHGQVIISEIDLVWEGGKHDPSVRGLFLEAELDMTLEEPVYIFPNSFERAGLTRAGDEVDLESVEFEEVFDVRGGQIAARRILTPLLMHRLLQLREKTPREKIYLSIHGNTLSILIPMLGDLFEPSIITGFDENAIMKHVEDIRLVLEVVRLLNLNKEVQHSL